MALEEAQETSDSTSNFVLQDSQLKPIQIEHDSRLIPEAFQEGGLNGIILLSAPFHPRFWEGLVLT